MSRAKSGRKTSSGNSRVPKLHYRPLAIGPPPSNQKSKREVQDRHVSLKCDCLAFPSVLKFTRLPFPDLDYEFYHAEEQHRDLPLALVSEIGKLKLTVSKVSSINAQRLFLLQTIDFHELPKLLSMKTLMLSQVLADLLRYV